MKKPGRKRLVVMLHNSLVLVEPLKAAFKEILPEVETLNIIDESLLRDLLKSGGIDHNGTKRVCQYTIFAEEIGADIVLMTCSSLADSVDVASKLVNIPVLKINEPMVMEAVRLGRRIAVLGTLSSVIEPTVRMLKEKAEKSGKKIDIKTVLFEEAFKALISGDKAGHDRLVLAGITKISKKVDAIILAQGSMARLVPMIDKGIKVPVLTCIISGVSRLKRFL
ncbi:MAG: Asp/Glu/hydantoin racemase [Nitrospinae bacterium]|nr:Asp/Glu/hydantoin racemase [Nitrospinota bacterium]